MLLIIYEKNAYFCIFIIFLEEVDNKDEIEMKQYKFVDLFAGCGGLSLGLQQAGFTPWFVNEIVEQFCNTYKYNHELSDDHYFVGDIADLNQHLDEYKNLLSDITLVCGGTSLPRIFYGKPTTHIRLIHVILFINNI